MSTEVSTNNPSPTDLTSPPTNGEPEVPSSNVKFYSGLDLGAFHSVVASSGAESKQIIDLECNDLAGRTTPSYVAFQKNTRLIGDTAESVMGKLPTNTFSLLPLLLGVSSKMDLVNLKSRFGFLVSCFEAMQDDGRLKVSFGGKEWHLAPSQILAVFLRRLAGFAVDGRNSKHLVSSKDAVNLSSGQFCISLPDALFEAEKIETTKKLIARACKTGALRWELTKVASQTTSTITGWIARNLSALPPFLADAEPVYVGFFNLGFSEATCQCVRLTRLETQAVENKHEDAMQDKVEPSIDGDMEEHLVFNNFRVQFLRPISIALGTIDFVHIVAQLYTQTLSSKNVDLDSANTFSAEAILSRAERKTASAVFSSSIKLLKDLSGLSVAHSTFAAEDVDIQVELSREQFEQAAASHFRALHDIVTSAVEPIVQAEGAARLLGIEAVGGGSRIPAVQRAIENAVTSLVESKRVALMGDSIVRRTLDGTAAAAVGATFIASGELPTELLPNVLSARDIESVWTSDQQREEYMHIEKAMRQVETDEAQRMEARNKLEAAIMKFKNLSRQADLKNAAELAKVTEGVSDWFYETMDQTVATQEYESREAQFVQKAEELCADYFEAERKQKEAVERELELKAQQMEGKEKEDHDFRKLPNSRRLEKAERNKTEGNDMFNAGNWLKAAERYQQALGHLDKMFDESPTELEKKRQLRISLNLNLAMVYSKQEGDEALGKVIHRCNMALSYDEENTRVLYRRGLAFEKRKNLEEALKDLQKCAKIQKATDGNVDPATTKALTRVKANLTRQEEQAKRMYAKMF
eukprot:Gregarina_sp_Poly_1__11034@NODE_882_length_5869_cov_169_457601_g631_i0_p1_GENE_NODE_882_length_5869_cov_169_457601_g631_i0NODE_882_length_5869_cov_169_457601_g631_i0_p1_ORF_typecomplete_len811_score152_20HSP70/PF00012_20/1e12HSP70/PF00012_20/9_1e02TPR_2/PF07719_17/7_5TPR_2/PF07719_17/0_00037TPR_19/PF14559_6/0_74TPR_19/PF14559_6/0_022TPR_15/PF13429_6/7_9e03TPR_15/PF13429_6/1_2e02TPR_15/PF13429_6/1_6e05TPR_9/PF13371_6/5e02TPR_9/PF13371_6/0_00053TPR_16/PF13432_6/6_4e03TPR_16/PF13432_6/0_006TPR_1/PF